jgi:hypothetical protein
MSCSPSRVTRTSTRFTNFIAFDALRRPVDVVSATLCSASRIWLRFKSLLFYSKMRARASYHPSSHYSVVTTNNTHSRPPIANILITACVEYSPRFYSSEQTYSQPHATLPTHYAPRCLAAHSTWSSANVAMK